MSADHRRTRQSPFERNSFKSRNGSSSDGSSWVTTSGPIP